MTAVRDTFEFIDMLTGYQPAMLIMAAERLGLFSVMQRELRTVDEIAAELDLDAPALEALLRSLVAIGLLEGGDDGFVATAFTFDHLRDGRDLALVVQKEEYFARAWLSLDDVVRTGRPVLKPWKNRLSSEPATAYMFLDALNVLAEYTGPRLWDLPELAPGRRVLDVGGGFGYYAGKLAEAGSTVVLVDMPRVIGAVGGRLADGPPESVVPIAADVMAEPSCGVAEASMDAALVSHMLHDLSVDDGVNLLRRVRSALVPGGTLIVNDFASDRGPGPFGRIFDVMMRVETGGRAHPLAGLHSMLESAGFGDVETLHFPEPLTVLKGRRI